MVNQEKVKKVAENARINLTDKEAQKYSEDFQNILEIFETIEEVDTEDTEPSFHPIQVRSKTRPDQKQKTLEYEETFQNAENKEDKYFKGPSA